jgi:hypothetical protein
MYFWTSPGDDFTDGLGFRIQTVMYFSTSPDDDFTDLKPKPITFEAHKP